VKLLYVAVILDRVTGSGTAERAVQLCRTLAATGTDCTLLALDIRIDAERRRELEGIRLRTMPCLNERFWIPAVAPGGIRKLVADADVVELCSHWTMLNAVVYRAARALGKPYLVAPAGALPIAGRSKVIKSLYNTAVGRGIIRNASGHVAITEGELPSFAAYGVDPARVVVIPNGVSPPETDDPDCDGFRARAKLGTRPFVLFMGRLNFVKGPDFLLDAFAQVAADFPGYDLVFAGRDDGLRQPLTARAAELGLASRVHFVGFLGSAEREAAYRSASLLAIPSRMDAMSLVAGEAGIRGTPVLLTDRCGFDEVETAGGGMVVPASPDGLADGLRALLRDPQRLAQMGRTLQAYLGSRFSWERSARIHQNLCRRLVDGTHRQGRADRHRAALDD
jgi:glycosyltransferase involved in cell wall biosynthesis